MNEPHDDASRLSTTTVQFGSGLHTTTVRFDADLWARLGLVAEELGVARSALIRDATREHVTRMEYEDRLAALEEHVLGLAGSVATLSKRLRQRPR